MPISKNDISISISPNPVRGPIGKSVTATLTFTNNSLTDVAYNLYAELFVPDGVELISSAQQVDRISLTSDYSQQVVWNNIQNLGPGESFTINVKLQGIPIFRNTSKGQVQFNQLLSNLVLRAIFDTMPRGNENPGNQKVEQTFTSSFIPTPYSVQISAPDKIPKGAGTFGPSGQAPAWKYDYIITVENNSISNSSAILTFRLNNGIRYINVKSVEGQDSSQFDNPIVEPPIPSGATDMSEDYTIITWNDLNLSKGSTNTITVEAAIWDKYVSNGVENAGGVIPHNTGIQSIAKINGSQGSVQDFATVKAMYFTVNKGVVNPITDVDQKNQFTITYGVNQYIKISSGTSMQPFQIVDTINDGQSYNNDANFPATNITTQSNGSTTVTWDITKVFPDDGGNTSVSKTIYYTTTTKQQYQNGTKVKSFDTLKNSAIMDALITSNGQYVSDNSLAEISIRTPKITKQFIKYYYNDNTPKTLNVGAPGDLAEFSVTYDATNLKAVQGGILIRDFFPNNFSNALQNPIYTGTFNKPGLAAENISPNGIQWNLEDIPGQRNWITTFKVPILEFGSLKGGTYNLATEMGVNNANKYYNARSTVNLNLGQPNLTMTKKVTGNDANNIKSGETYTYTVTINNVNDGTNTVTDAFRMILTDVIPIGLTYVNSSAQVTGTGTYTDPTVSNQNLTMSITKLEPGQSLTLTYDVTVNNNVPSGSILKNRSTLSVPYSQPTGTYQYPQFPVIATISLKTATILQLTKIASPSSTKIGDIVNYILEITVPKGANVSNLQLVDTFPHATQQFIPGSVTKDRVHLQNQPTPVGGTLTFPPIPSIQAPTKPITITYSFEVTIKDAAADSNFIDRQVNNATLTWTDTTTGIPGTPVNASANLNVKIPSLTISKTQSNISKNKLYVSTPVQFEGSDTLSYKITITNVGKSTSYSNHITDTISKYFTINSASVNYSKGKATFTGNNLSWKIKGLTPNETATLIFNITPIHDLPTTLAIQNQASVTYASNTPNAIKTYGPVASNTVVFNLTNIEFTKSATPTKVSIGDQIEYTLTLNVGEGSTIYDVLAYDMLPFSQEYINGSATKQIDSGIIESVTPTVTTEILGNKVLFPQPIVGNNNDIVATDAPVKVKYIFKAVVKQGLETPPYSEMQTDNAYVMWDAVGDGSSPQNRQSSAIVQVDTPNIVITKEQKNFTMSGPSDPFTKGNILASEGDVIHYRIRIESKGASPAYTIKFKDILSNNLEFMDDVTQPTEGTVVHPNEILNQVLEWNIPILDERSSAVYTFAVRVSSIAKPGTSFNNNMFGTYLTVPTNGKTYNATSNTVTTLVGGVTATKTANNKTVNLGDEILYTITVNIPGRATLYNLQVTDKLDPGQEYIAGSWTTNYGTVGTPILSNADTNIVYVDTNNSITAPVSGLTIVYTFKARVTSSRNMAPYSEVQTNIANITWANIPDGNKVSPIVLNEDVTVNRPNLIATKLQRNVTKLQTTFSTLPLKDVEVNDVIEYQLNLNNTGTAPAYNVVSTDTLGANLTFVDETNPQITNAGQVVTWTLVDPINPGSTSTVTIQATVGAGFNPGDNVINKFTTKYESSIVTPPIKIGPISSNEVGFEYTNVVLEKYIVKNNTDFVRTTAMIGDEIEYKIVLTVPEGSIAYEVGVEDVLDTNQTYVANSLTSIGGVPIPAVTPTLPNPLANEGTIDATTGEKTIIYIFKVKINSVVVGEAEDNQINTAFVDWNVSPGGAKGPTQNVSISVYVSGVNLTIDKSQSIDNINFVTDLVDVNIGQRIYYKLVITNPSIIAELYDVNIIDRLPAGYVLQGIESIQSTSEIIVDNKSLGSNELNIIIPRLDANSSSTIVFSAILVGPVVPGKDLINSATTTYSLNLDGLNRIYGPIKSNEVTSLLQEQNIDFIKSTNTADVQLGDIIQYSLNVEIPEGVVVYNAELEDTLPVGQIYMGEATLNGDPIQLNQQGQKLTSQPIPIIDASDAPITLSYTFNVRVVAISTSSSYEELQKNTAWFTWYTDETGMTTTEVTTNTNIIVRSANLSLRKLQRNTATGEIFDNTDINVIPGDLIQYELIVENSGSAPAYNVVTSDILEAFTTFSKVILNGIGTVNFNDSNNELTWNIDILHPNEVAILIFEVRVLNGASAGLREANYAKTVFNTSLDDPLIKGPIYSEHLYHNYPYITIQKISNQSNYVVGSTVNYSLIVTIPRGIKFYNLDVDDILPPEQLYVSSTLNGAPITPQVVGQIIQFPTIEEGQAGQNDLVYNYEITAIIENGNFTVDPVQVQQNSANITWSLDPDDINSIGPISSVFDINVIENKLLVEKFQKLKKEITPFTKDNIQAYKGETIQYKIVVTNIGIDTVFLPIIEDIIDKNLEFLQVTDTSIGTVYVENKLPDQQQNTKLIWKDIPSLNSEQSIEMTYEALILTNTLENIYNFATGTFEIIDGGERFNSLDSNTVLVESLGSLYSFIPDENSYLTDTEALSYGVVGCNGKIGYILTSNYETVTSFDLEIDPIPFSYKLFINGIFVEEVQSNTPYNDDPEGLNSITKGGSRTIELLYNIPDWYNITSDSVQFNTTVSPIGNNDPKTINNNIDLGKVTLTTSYDVNEYPKNPSLFSVNYNINISVSKGIKVYDLELSSLYPPSSIFQKAYKNGIEIQVINLSGEVIYPIIEEIDATGASVQINYNYEVLQYKKTPLSIGALERNNSILSLRTAKNIQDKCIFESSTLQVPNGEELECIYVDKVFGKCVQYYSYENIKIPVIQGYEFKEIIFSDPEIVVGSLTITPSECDKNFSKVKYDFSIPYKIIYQGCGCLGQGKCSPLPTKEIEGVLEIKSLEIIIYTPEDKGNVYDIVSQTIVKNIVVNDSQTEFCVCIGVVTSSIAKTMMLINNLGKCEFIYCCPSCSNIINSKLK